MIIGWFLLAGVFSFFTVSAVYWWARRAHILAVPNERSSHTTPTPVAGGLAISGITLVGLANYWLFESAFYTSELLAYSIGALLISSISFMDDIYSMSPSIRLAFHFLAAVLVVLFIGTIDSLALPWGDSIDTGYLALPLSILWVVGVTNAYNFMDGVDGMAGTYAVVVGLAWACTCWLLGLQGLAFAALIVTCASLGFLVHNWPPARIFMGDVGSVFLGYTFAVIALLTAQLDERLLVAGGVFLAPFLFDTSFTLMRRLRQREDLLQPHRTHLYQRMVSAGYSHRVVTLIYGIACAVSSTGAVLWLLGVREGDIVMGAAVILTCSAIWGVTLWAENHAPSLTKKGSQVDTPLRSEVSGQRLFSVWSLLVGVSQRLGVVFIALVSALIVRFLWMTSIEGAVTPQTYWTYVNASREAFRGSVVPAAILGLIVFGGLEILDRSRRARNGRLFFTCLPYSIFFSAILIYRFIPIGGVHFPRLTWVVAWMISLLMVVVAGFIRDLQAGNRKEESYSVASEIVIDGVLIALAFVGAYLVRFETLPLPDPFQEQLFLLLPYVVLSGVAFNYLWGVYSFLWRFTGLRESLVIAQSVASMAFLFLLLRIALFQAHELLRIPFGVVVAFPILMYSGLIGARLLRCWQYQKEEQGRRFSPSQNGAPRRLLLVGAGATARRWVGELNGRSDVHVGGLVDDEPRKTGKLIDGVRVLGKTEQIPEFVKNHQIDEVVFCMPRAAGRKMRYLVSLSRRAGVRIMVAPGPLELLGNTGPGSLRPIEVGDFLGRAVQPEFQTDDPLLLSRFASRKVLITGAAGSIGSELTRQLGTLAPERLILLDRDENGLYEGREKLDDRLAVPFDEVIADIRSESRMEQLFRELRPQVIFHAAAYKHVPMMEAHPAEAVLNNVFATRSLMYKALCHGAETFVLISSDKAVQPSSVMGATKRIAELLARQLAGQATQTRFCTVRFGNVMGSRASVLPVFRNRIDQGRSIRVTHPAAERYFMTISEATQLVIQAGALADQGALFLLDMGEPVRILDLAHQVIETSGLVPGEDVAIEFTGLRPGEKLREELLFPSERAVRSQDYPGVFVVRGGPDVPVNFDAGLKRLEEAAWSGDSERVIRALQEMDIDYTPS